MYVLVKQGNNTASVHMALVLGSKRTNFTGSNSQHYDQTQSQDRLTEINNYKT